MFDMLKIEASRWAYLHVMLRNYWNLIQLELDLVSKNVKVLVLTKKN